MSMYDLIHDPKTWQDEQALDVLQERVLFGKHDVLCTDESHDLFEGVRFFSHFTLQKWKDRRWRRRKVGGEEERRGEGERREKGWSNGKGVGEGRKGERMREGGIFIYIYTHTYILYIYCCKKLLVP